MNRPIALECKNCGAMLRNNQTECEYCGTNYKWTGDYRPYVGPTLQKPIETSWYQGDRLIYSSTAQTTSLMHYASTYPS